MNGLAAQVLRVTGAGCVVAGGVVAAVTRPLDLELGSWLAAYLVLVCGVGAYAIGSVQGRADRPALSTRLGWTELGSWIAGNLVVIIGSLVGQPLVVDLGAILLVVALMIAILDSTRFGATLPAWNRTAYRLLLLVLLVGAPVGAVLAHLRHGG